MEFFFSFTLKQHRMITSYSSLVFIYKNKNFSFRFSIYLRPITHTFQVYARAYTSQESEYSQRHFCINTFTLFRYFPNISRIDIFIILSTFLNFCTRTFLLQYKLHIRYLLVKIKKQNNCIYASIFKKKLIHM